HPGGRALLQLPARGGDGPVRGRRARRRHAVGICGGVRPAWSSVTGRADTTRDRVTQVAKHEEHPMAGALRKTMAYLGLSEDEREQYIDEFDGAEAYDEPALEPEQHTERTAQVTPISRAAVVRAEPEPELRRISTVHPTTYNEARVIGE